VQRCGAEGVCKLGEDWADKDFSHAGEGNPAAPSRPPACRIQPPSMRPTRSVVTSARSCAPGLSAFRKRTG
jgi:hypothetical protein